MDIHKTRLTVTPDSSHTNINICDNEMERLLNGEVVTVLSENDRVFDLKYIGTDDEHTRIAQRYADSKSPWISVDVALPTTDDYVLVTTSDDQVTMAKFVENVWIVAEVFEYSMDSILAWMPKFKPFQVSDKEAANRIENYIATEDDIPPRTLVAMRLAISRLSGTEPMTNSQDQKDTNDTSKV